MVNLVWNFISGNLALGGLSSGLKMGRFIFNDISAFRFLDGFPYNKLEEVDFTEIQV